MYNVLIASRSYMHVWLGGLGGADVNVNKIPTTLKIISLKKIRFYSESN
jgi:hypothetical protein